MGTATRPSAGAATVNQLAETAKAELADLQEHIDAAGAELALIRSTARTVETQALDIMTSAKADAEAIMKEALARAEEILSDAIGDAEVLKAIRKAPK